MLNSTDRRDESAPFVVVVEPYHGAEGHFSKTAKTCEAALRAAGAEVHVVVSDEGRPRSVRERLTLTGFRLTGTLARILRRLLRFSGRLADVRHELGEVAGGLEALVDELPVLVTAVHHTRRAGERPTGIVFMSSRARPHRCKATRTAGLATVDFLFDQPVGGPWQLGHVPESYSLVVTTQRLRALLAAATPRIDAPLLSHLPLAPLGSGRPTERITEALGRAASAPEGWLLFFGAMHGKKNLASVSELVEHLPATVGLLIAGDPLLDGVRLVEIARRAAQRHPHLAVIDQRISDEEAAALLSAGPVVLVADHRSTVSLSGVLIEAVAAGCPVIATEDCSSGEVVKSAGIGQVYGDPTHGAILDAFRAAESKARPVIGDPFSLERHGMLAERQWGEHLLQLLRLPSQRNVDFVDAID